jgi:hypothetical protein
VVQFCRLRVAALGLVCLFAAIPNPQLRGVEQEETERTEMKKSFALLPLFSPVQKSATGNPQSWTVPGGTPATATGTVALPNPQSAIRNLQSSHGSTKSRPAFT